YRTSLELCKLLLSLDPDEDPLGVLLMIDFYALQSEQFSFLVRLFEEWEPHRNLSQLPNFAYSAALAYFQFNRKHCETKRADELLQAALIMFPMVLSPLMEKCNVALDSSLIQHPFFSPLKADSEPLALKQLEALYIGRTYHVWKEPEVGNTTATPVGCAPHFMKQQPNQEDNFLKTLWRQVRYRGTPRNIYRHLVMSDIKDAVTSLPMDLVNVPLLSYDPLPPQDSVTGYSRPTRRIEAVGENSGPLSMFFRSLLPSFSPQTPNGPHVEVRLEQPVEGAGGGPRPLRDTELVRGVENLMVAMRELLNTLSYRGQPEEAGGEEGEDGREDNHAEDDWEEEWD
ncbi:transcription factor 25-like, partial [Stylophora pistillata]|uniref:transcription factor 25-like n=1 Tax=Stylophora pistillata TaxID=50429 RepID=UPI000C0524BB